MTARAHSHDGLFREIHQLADAVVSGEATVEQRERLELLVNSSDEACNLYVDYMNETAGICRLTRDQRLMSFCEEQLAARGLDQEAGDSSNFASGGVAPASASGGSPAVSPTARSSARFLGIVAVLAVGGVAAGILLFFFLSDADVRPEMPPQRVARISRTVDAVWAQHGTGIELALGDWLTTGRYTLTAGVVQIAFPSGTEVTLEAPAEVVFSPGGALRLLFGQLVAKVSPEDSGFAIDTASVEVIDLGTEFGLSVSEDGKCEVHVFKGAVEARQKWSDSAAPAGPIVLPAGAATGFGVRDAFGRPVAFNPKRFSKAWRVASRVVETQGAMRFIHPPPASVVAGETEGNEKLLLFLEAEGVRLPEPAAVTLAEPGVYSDFADRAAWLPAGLEVDSYLVHFDAVGSKLDQAPVTVQGSVTFDRPIVGIIARGDQLASSDALFAYPGTRYMPSPSWLWLAEGNFHVNRPRSCLIRGLNGLQNVVNPRVSPAPNDGLELGADRRTLTVRCSAGGESDQLRILVANLDDDAVLACSMPIGGAPQPYYGRPFVVGETIEAEDYDRGGQDVAYYDTTPDALASVYRMGESVELGSYVREDKTETVVWMTRTGEWIAYSIEIDEPGTYRVLARVGAGQEGGRFRIEFGVAATTGSLPIPQTKALRGLVRFAPEYFETIASNPVQLESGRHVMRVVMEANHEGGWVGDFDWFRIERVEDAPRGRRLGQKNRRKERAIID